MDEEIRNQIKSGIQKKSKASYSIDLSVLSEFDKLCTAKEYKKSQRPYFQGTLGNLLPLSQSINSSLQNDCFEEKKKAKYNDKKEKIRQGYSDGSHSEIEVASYHEWIPEAILDRGYKLLEFMERRWELKFENEYAKAELLFLDFMFPDEEEDNQTGE